MSDWRSRAIANLPSRNFEITRGFYERLGFAVTYHSDEWLWLRWGTVEIEFFPHPFLDPEGSWFSATIETEALDEVAQRWRASVPTTGRLPKITPIDQLPEGIRLFAVLDPDRNLLRCRERKKLNGWSG
jgi:catechol 2,3-dioxygenase-like lactoylglutathione lyase family enzyme